MADITFNPRPCILCDELVYASDDEKTWGIVWSNRWIHYRCVYNLFDAVRRIQGKPEVVQLEGENERLKVLLRDMSENSEGRYFYVDEITEALGGEK